MLEDREIEDYKLAKVPIDPGIKLVKFVYQGQSYQVMKRLIQGYQSLVGFLLWLACMTCQDISFSVRKCRQYESNPTPTYNIALKKLINILKDQNNWA